VLYEVAQIIIANIRPAEMVSRYGGDEFIILLPDKNIETARLMANRLRDAMKKALPVPCGDHDVFHPTLSMGLAAMKSGQTPAMFIHAADEAMYRAKENGRDCFSE
jgi:diguanylate cyclase